MAILRTNPLSGPDPAPAPQPIGQTPQAQNRYSEPDPCRSSKQHAIGDRMPPPDKPYPEMPDEISKRLGQRSEEHTSELQSLMRISYAVFCLKKQKDTQKSQIKQHNTSQQHSRRI